MQFYSKIIATGIYVIRNYAYLIFVFFFIFRRQSLTDNLFAHKPFMLLCNGKQIKGLPPPHPPNTHDFPFFLRDRQLQVFLENDMQKFQMLMLLSVQIKHLVQVKQTHTV